MCPTRLRSRAQPTWARNVTTWSRLIGPLDLAAGTALDTLRGGAGDVVLGDPALIVALVGSGGGTGGLAARGGLRDLGLLDLLGGGLGATGLGEESLDPGLVHEVDGSAEETSQEEVEEDAGVTESVIDRYRGPRFPIGWLGRKGKSRM